MWNLSSSFEELDIKRLYDLRAAGRKSSSLSKSYEELLKVITCTMAKLNIVQPDKRRETTDLWATKQMALSAFLWLLWWLQRGNCGSTYRG